MNIYAKYILLVAVLLATSQLSDGRKTLSGRSRGSSGSSSSSGGRRHQSSSSGNSHSYSQSSGHVTKPTYNNPKPAPNPSHVQLSYAPAPAPNKPSAPQMPSHGAGSQPVNSQARPIGWNVPNKPETPAVAVNKPPVHSGPPPAYSPRDTAGGARTNVHEPPPVYSPGVQSRPPGYPGQPSGIYPASPGGGGYPHQSGSVNSGSGYPHQNPGQAQVVHHYHHKEGSSSYPRQPGIYPQQAYQSHSQPVHYAPPPAGIPPGYVPQQSQVYHGPPVATGFYPVGAIPQQQSSGSGLGFGSGLVAGGLAGALLTNAFSSHGGHRTEVIREQAPLPANSNPTIIINNSPAGTTVEGAGQQPGVATGYAPVQPAPVGGPVQPGSTYVAPPDQPIPLAPYPNAAPQPPQAAGAPITPVMVPPVNAAAPPQGPADPSPTPPAQPLNPNELVPGQAYVYCYDVKVSVPDPQNPGNFTEVTEQRCDTYVPPPPPGQQSQMPADQPMAPMPGQENQQTPLAPMPPQYNQPAVPPPPPTQRTSTAELAPSSQLKSGSQGLSDMTSRFGVVLSAIAILVTKYTML